MAERAKDRNNFTTITSRFYIEVLIPVFAIMTLFSVTIYFTSQAVKVLQNPNRGDDNINIMYLYVFPGMFYLLFWFSDNIYLSVKKNYCYGLPILIDVNDYYPLHHIAISINLFINCYN